MSSDNPDNVHSIMANGKTAVARYYPSDDHMYLSLPNGNNGGALQFRMFANNIEVRYKWSTGVNWIAWKTINA